MVGRSGGLSAALAVAALTIGAVAASALSRPGGPAPTGVAADPPSAVAEDEVLTSEAGEPVIGSTPPPRPEYVGPVASAGPPLADVYAQAGLSVPDGPTELAGCPPPPPEPGTGGAGIGWSPPITVAESALPAPAATGALGGDVDPLRGKGMWIWQYRRTEGGDYGAMIDRAVAAGLDHLWVRVGDSRHGFYGPKYLDTLVPMAHAAGLEVIGWGFPFLHDPMHDVRWSTSAIEWVGPHGRGLDGFSPDIEMATEGVELSAVRVAVYLSHLRAAAPDALIPATVYPPVDWVVEAGYPYEVMAPFVDAFVPMDYWMCREPGDLVAQSIERLSHLRPVHVIGQAFHNTTHGRRVAPSADETLRFLDVAVRDGAIGASLWVWQDIGTEQWDALAAYPWHEAVGALGHAP